MENEYDNRIEHVRKKMAEQGADACLISMRINLYYICGSIFDGYFYLPLKGEPLCFLRRPAVTGYRSYEIRKPEQIPEIFIREGITFPKTIMLEDNYLTVNEWNRYKNLFPGVICTSDLVREARAVKTPFEISLLRDSAIIHAGIYRKIPGFFKDGMTDLELSFLIENEARLLGHLGVMRIFGAGMEIHMGSVLAGDNALSAAPYDFAMGGAGMHASLPIGPNGTAIRDGMTVMVDISGNFNGYLTDMTRIFAHGKIDPKAIELHKISIEIQDTIADRGTPGTACGDLFDDAMKIIDHYRVAEHYMGEFQRTRFVGHGVGLEINELPVLYKGNKTQLEKNMAIALEPKFALRGTGPVGTENTYIVGDKGLEKITIFNEDIMSI